MSYNSATMANVRWFAIAAVAGLAAVTAAMSLATAEGYLAALALAGVLVLLFVATQVPVIYLPSVALATFALVPPGTIPGNPVTRVVGPAAAILVIWVIRKTFSNESKQSARNVVPATVAAALGFLLWCLVLIVSSDYLRTAVVWTISFAIGAVLVLAVRPDGEARVLKATWLWLGGVLGAYALVESVIGANFVFGALTEALGSGSVQHWSLYRATASFGHPLFAGTFFAIAFAMAFGEWMSEYRRRSLVLALASLVGLVLTLSRGSMTAAAVAVVAVVAVCVVNDRTRLGSRLPLIVIGSVVVGQLVWSFSGIATRFSSVEASRSSDTRDSGQQIALDLAEDSSYLGTGPGTSQLAVSSSGFPDVPIENSYHQLLISVGVPGLLLFLSILASAIYYAASRNNLAVLGALVAYAVCIYGYNVIDARLSMHILFGLILIILIGDSRTTHGADPELIDEGLPVSKISFQKAARE